MPVPQHVFDPPFNIIRCSHVVLDVTNLDASRDYTDGSGENQGHAATDHEPSDADDDGRPLVHFHFLLHSTTASSATKATLMSEGCTAIQDSPPPRIA